MEIGGSETRQWKPDHASCVHLLKNGELWYWNASTFPKDVHKKRLICAVATFNRT